MTDYLDIVRTQSISASPEVIAGQIVDFHNWRSWSPWEDLDPDLKRSFSGSDSGVGAVYEWVGNKKAGEGRMEIVSASDREIQVDLRFFKPFKSTATVTFTLTPSGDTTDVRWVNSMSQNTLMKVMNFFFKFDKSIGNDLDKGLDRLKAVVEAQ